MPLLELMIGIDEIEILAFPEDRGAEVAVVVVAVEEELIERVFCGDWNDDDDVGGTGHKMEEY